MSLGLFAPLSHVSCLSVPAKMEPKRIKRIHESQKVSQPLFARYLNTSESTSNSRIVALAIVPARYLPSTAL